MMNSRLLENSLILVLGDMKFAVICQLKLIRCQGMLKDLLHNHGQSLDLGQAILDNHQLVHRSRHHEIQQ